MHVGVADQLLLPRLRVLARAERDPTSTRPCGPLCVVHALPCSTLHVGMGWDVKKRKPYIFVIYVDDGRMGQNHNYTILFCYFSVSQVKSSIWGAKK